MTQSKHKEYGAHFINSAIYSKTRRPPVLNPSKSKTCFLMMSISIFYLSEEALYTTVFHKMGCPAVASFLTEALEITIAISLLGNKISL